MMFSTRSEYGVRVMIQLGAPARRRARSRSPSIAEAEDLPLPYLEQLVVAPAQGRPRVVDARRARRLRAGARPGRDHDGARWCSALEGTLVPMQCFDRARATSRVLCNHEMDGYENCATKLLWTRVQGGVDAGARADDARRAGRSSPSRRRPQPRAAPRDRCRRAARARARPRRPHDYRKAEPRRNGRPRDPEPARQRRGQGDPARAST